MWLVVNTLKSHSANLNCRVAVLVYTLSLFTIGGTQCRATFVGFVDWFRHQQKNYDEQILNENCDLFEPE